MATTDYGFLWITGVTADGTILVANNYGIAYIPDGVMLPEPVRMASADTSIPVAERARWATYPILAVQGWAAHHNTRLRAVFGTEAQLAGFDPGAEKVYLREDDIPESGKMVGRNRLQVVAPEEAARLAAMGDASLTELLPPASADTNPPEDQTFVLWWDVTKPLMSQATGRDAAHLQAFLPYAEHAAELALYRAHAATTVEAQRAAVADWLYWLYQQDTLADALTVDPGLR